MIPSLETDHSRHLLLFVCYKNNYDNNMAMVPSFLPSIHHFSHSLYCNYSCVSIYDTKDCTSALVVFSVVGGARATHRKYSFRSRFNSVNGRFRLHFNRIPPYSFKRIVPPIVGVDTIALHTLRVNPSMACSVSASAVTCKRVDRPCLRGATSNKKESSNSSICVSTDLFLFVVVVAVVADGEAFNVATGCAVLDAFVDPTVGLVVAELSVVTLSPGEATLSPEASELDCCFFLLFFFLNDDAADLDFFPPLTFVGIVTAASVLMASLKECML